MRLVRLGVVGFLMGTALAFFGGGSANAAVSHCTQYLHDVGYSVGPVVSGACQKSAVGQTVACILSLYSAGVARNHADFACQLAKL